MGENSGPPPSNVAADENAGPKRFDPRLPPDARSPDGGHYFVTYGVTFTGKKVDVAVPFKFASGGVNAVFSLPPLHEFVPAGVPASVLRFWEAQHFAALCGQAFSNELISNFFLNAFASAMKATLKILAYDCSKDRQAKRWFDSCSHRVNSDPVLRKIFEFRDRGAHIGANPIAVGFEMLIAHGLDGKVRAAPLLKTIAIEGQLISDPKEAMAHAISVVAGLLEEAKTAGFLKASNVSTVAQFRVRLAEEQADGKWAYGGQVHDENMVRFIKSLKPVDEQWPTFLPKARSANPPQPA